MANTLKAGSKTPGNNYADSMAQAMEDAFKKEWRIIMGKDTDPKIQEDLQLMFIAVAQGVVRHLVDNHEAFRTRVPKLNDSGTELKELEEIQTTGTLYE